MEKKMNYLKSFPLVKHNVGSTAKKIVVCIPCLGDFKNNHIQGQTDNLTGQDVFKLDLFIWSVFLTKPGSTAFIVNFVSKNCDFIKLQNVYNKRFTLQQFWHISSHKN